MRVSDSPSANTPTATTDINMIISVVNMVFFKFCLSQKSSGRYRTNPASSRRAMPSSSDAPLVCAPSEPGLT